MNIINKGRDAHRFRPLKVRKPKTLKTEVEDSKCALLFGTEATIHADDDSGSEDSESVSEEIKEEAEDIDDDDAELQLELEAIKREKQERSEAEANQKRVEQLKQVAESVTRNRTVEPGDWTSDAVFQVKHREIKESHVNDTLRSKFHKRFLERHIV